VTRSPHAANPLVTLHRGFFRQNLANGEDIGLSHSVLFQLAAIVVLGFVAQWVSWRTRQPSILLLLAAGVLAGPVTGWLDPDYLFGDLALPIVSLSVAVILYEGGLNLKFRELRNIGGAFTLLTTAGVGISWLVGAAAGRFILGFQWPIAALLGAILVVTGPTVIGPILRHLRLRGRVGALLKWEGIVIDPVGATLAVLVFTVIEAGTIREGLSEAALALGSTLLAGVVAGCAAAGVLLLAFSRFWIPDILHNPASMGLMFAAFTAANHFQNESGLLAVTVMGIALANQRWVAVRHVVEFKETLTVLLIPSLFIILAARLRAEELLGLGWESFAFVAVMIVVARPVSVLVSTWRSSLSWKERLFLCCMAPRGIVAAAISSVFALSLSAAVHPRAMGIVPVVFLVVFSTVLLYGAAAGPLARRLSLTQANPQGVLFLGAHPWARALAVALREEDVPVFIVDTDWENIRDARMAGLPCIYGSVLAQETREEIDFTGLGKMLALTSNDEVNSLACLWYSEDFGRQQVYQLALPSFKKGKHEVISLEHRGRLLFREDMTFTALGELVGLRPKVKKTRLTREFDYKAFQTEYGDTVLTVFVVKADRSVHVSTVQGLPEPKPGDLVISVIRGEGPV
jgi:NhaP-type Na+/H+ or K+/H+ antiporter